MADFDLHIKDGTVVDGTRVPRYRADVWIHDGKIAQIGGRAPGFAKKRHRRRRPDRRARLRRSAHPLRRADPLGSLLHHLRMAWRDLAGARQLRLRLRAGQARFPRPLDAHDDAHRGDSLRVDEGRDAVGLGDHPAVPRFARPRPQGRQLHPVHADRLADDLRDGPRGREDPPRHRRGARRDAPAARARAWTPGSADSRSSASVRIRPRPTSTARRWSPTRCATRTSSTSPRCCASATKASSKSPRRPATSRTTSLSSKRLAATAQRPVLLPGDHCQHAQESGHPSQEPPMARAAAAPRVCRFSARPAPCAAASPSRSSIGTSTM